MNHLLLLTGPAFVLIVAAVPAQFGTLVVPTPLSMREGVSTGTIAGFSSCHRMQVLVTGALLQPMQGQAMTALWFRRDDMWGKPYLASTSQLVVEVSTAALPPLAPSTTFATNHGSDRTTVFQGSITLPANQNPPVPAPWNTPYAVRIPFAAPFTYRGGDLCLQIEGTPQNPPPRFSWWVDYEQETAGGIVQKVGQPCGPATAEHVTTASADPARLVPGSTLSLHGMGVPNTAGVLAVGTRLSAPIPLDSFGAPGCTLHVQTMALLGGIYPPPAVGSYSAMLHDVPIPPSPTLLGGRFTVQGVDLDPAANSLGLALTEALDLTLCSQMPPASLSIVTSDFVAPGTPFPNTGRVWVSRGPVMLFEY